jgi:phage-related protein
MPQTEVVFFMDKTGHAPALEWIQKLPIDAQEKLGGSIKRLSEKGHELRRPECDYLRDKVYELRARLRSTNYRLLYFFHQQRAVISHGLIKEDAVPPQEIDKAITNKILYEQNPERHMLNVK